MPEVTPAEVVASWPPKGEWNYAIVNTVVDPINTHPIVAAGYDEVVDTTIVFLPDGSRRHAAFVREETTRSALWRRGWADMTDDFRALAAKVEAAEVEAAEENRTVAEVEASVLAAIRGSEAKRGVTSLFVARAVKVEPEAAEALLGRMVAGGALERVGDGGPVVLYREPKKIAG